MVDTARAISQQKPELNVSNVKTLLDCFRQDYRQTVADPTSLYTAMRSNSAYSGQCHDEDGGGDDGKILKMIVMMVGEGGSHTLWSRPYFANE